MLGTESETQSRGTLLRGCEEVMALVVPNVIRENWLSRD